MDTTHEFCRPQLDLTEFARLIPLALLAGSVGGLLAGALSAQLPLLREQGAAFGQVATWLGAALTSLTSLLALVEKQRGLMAATDFRFGPDTLLVTWPGHGESFPWDRLGRIERVPGGLRLHRYTGPACQLFGLRDRDATEQVIQALLEMNQKSQEHRASAA